MRTAPHEALRSKRKIAETFREGMDAAARALRKWGHWPLDWFGFQAICSVCGNGATLEKHEDRWYLTGPATEDKCWRRR